MVPLSEWGSHLRETSANVVDLLDASIRCLIDSTTFGFSGVRNFVFSSLDEAVCAGTFSGFFFAGLARVDLLLDLCLYLADQHGQGIIIIMHFVNRPDPSQYTFCN